MKLRRVLVLGMVMLLTIGVLAGCAGTTPSNPPAPTKTAEAPQTDNNKQTATPEPAKQMVTLTIPHYKTGENVGAIFFLPQVDRFNAKYDGQYKIIIEEIPQDMYAEKIKQLGQQKKLPALIEGGENTWLEDVVIPGNMYYDLNGMLNEHPEVKELLLKDSLDYNTIDGKVMSITYPVVRPMTMYYNGDMVQFSKPINDMSWDEFLAELGDNKIAFMTGENAWTTMLALSSMIAVEPGGAELLTSGVVNKIEDFSQAPIVNAVAKLQAVLQKYASSNTVGAVYADAANAFMSKNAAVIPNGSWMVGDFAPDASEKWSNGFDGSTVRGAVLPGNVGLANVLGRGWWIPATVTEEEAEAAKAFLAFMNSPEELELYMLAEGGTAPNLKPSEAFLAKRAENKLLDEYVGAVKKDTIIVPAFGDAVPSSIASTELGKLLPKLIDGSMTAEQFCAELTQKAAESKLN